MPPPAGSLCYGCQQEQASPPSKEGASYKRAWGADVLERGGGEPVKKEHITRYIRPEDIPLVDRAILEPILSSVAKEMHEAHPDQSVEEWFDDLHKALLRGDVLIVIDDVRRRLGLVRTDEPPFSGLVDPTRSPGPTAFEAADPLNLKEWERRTRESDP